jgi:hypothetical protein
MPITNTRENAKKLESLGAPTPLARGIAEILEDAIQANNQDLKTFFREELQREMALLRSEIKAEFASLRSESKADIASLRSDMHVMRADLQREMRQQLLWFFTMAAGIATIAVAVIKLFPNAG